MFSRILRILERIGHAASFHADVPPFVVWLYHHCQQLWAMMMQEPIGSLALLCALAVAIVLAWLIARARPQIF